MPTMTRAVAALIGLLALAACERAGAGVDLDGVTRAEEAASVATAQVAELAKQLDDLEERLEAAETARDRARGIVKRASASIVRLNASLDDVRADSAAASETAAAAAGRADELARLLRVLESRLDYHLRNAHR